MRRLFFTLSMAVLQNEEYALFKMFMKENIHVRFLVTPDKDFTTTEFLDSVNCSLKPP